MKIPLAPTFLALAALVASPFVAAEKADSNKPMFIEADALKHEESSKTTTFTGRVNGTKGTLVLRAAKMIITQDADGKQMANLWAAPGERVFFRQKREGLDEFTEGEAETANYDSDADKITLTGRSELRIYKGTRLSDRVQGHLIVYNNISEVFTVDPASALAGPAGSVAPARIKAMLSPRNNLAEDSPSPPTGSEAPLRTPPLSSSPRLLAPPGGKP